NTASGSWDGVSLTIATGLLQQAVNAAIGTFSANTPTVAVGGAVKSVLPALSTWQAVALTEAVGAIYQGITNAVGKWLGNIVTSTGGQALPVNFATGKWLGVTPSYATGAIEEAVLTALATWQGNSAGIDVSALNKAVNTATGIFSAVDLTVLSGGGFVNVGQAQAIIEAVAATGILGNLPKQVLQATGIFDGVATTPLVSGNVPVPVGEAYGYWTASAVEAYFISVILSAAVRAAYLKALAKVRQKGIEITITYKKKGTHNPLTGTFTAPSYITVSGYGIEIPFSPTEYEKDELTPETATSLFFVPSVLGIDIHLGGTLDWAGTARTLTKVVPISPDGTLIAAKLTVTNADQTNVDTGLDLYTGDWSKAIRRVLTYGKEVAFTDDTYSGIEGYAVEIPGDPEEYEILELQGKSPI
ncbi:MAG: hypothetical protein ACWGQW_22715, partial [bacterium]